MNSSHSVYVSCYCYSHLQSASNWEGGVVPSSLDDVIISLPSSLSVVSLYRADPWDSFDSQEQELDNDSTQTGSHYLTITSPWTIHSLSIFGSATFVVSSPFTCISVSLSPVSSMFVKGAIANIDKLIVEGTITADLGEIRGADITIKQKGNMKFSSDGGSNRIKDCKVNVEGTVRDRDITQLNHCTLSICI